MAPTDDFDRRLASAQARRDGGRPRESNPSPLGIAFRIGTELVAAIAIGTGMGWLLDRWLGTSPWLLLVFFLLGMAAGFRNVFRHARATNEAASRAKDLPSVSDDDGK